MTFLIKVMMTDGESGGREARSRCKTGGGSIFKKRKNGRGSAGAAGVNRKQEWRRWKVTASCSY